VGAFAECADVVTCCADGIARVWTNDAAKVDPAAAAGMSAAMAAAEEERARANLADQQSKIKTEDPSALQGPGASDGATKVIKEEGGTVAAYAWSVGTGSWERLGEVTGVGGGGAGDKKEYKGVEYDYVFDVDIQEGAPALKLPFNKGDNPYEAAEKFLEDNDLPPGYREQVVNFIVQNVGEANMSQGANVDPFTGSGAYVPGGGGGGGAGSGGVGADPFTGAGAYVPGNSGGGVGGGGGFGGGGGGSVDPFTGAGAYTPASTASSGGGGGAGSGGGGGGLKFIPMKQCLFFESAKFDGILKKLAEFGAQVPSPLAGP
jgi:phospholipase A-2-activating protein